MDSKRLTELRRQLANMTLFDDEGGRLAAVRTLAADGSAAAIRVLADFACRAGDDNARAAACVALRSLPEGPAADALCQRWAASRHPTLEALLIEGGVVARKPVELRVLSSLKANCLEPVDGRSAQLVAALLVAAADGDPEIAERAMGALGMTYDEVQEALCRMAVESGDERALAITAKAGYLPEDPLLRAAMLALTGRWKDYDAFDFDGAHLSAAYEAAAPEFRRSIAAAARAAGRADWVRAAVGGRQRRRLAAMTRSEWEAVLALLAHPGHASESWRLAREAPPHWARPLLLTIDAVALPVCEREDFARLRALAERCGEGVAFAARTECVAKLRGHEAEVLSLAITPDGRLLASGSDDQSIRLWRLPDGECLATLRGHRGAVTSLAATPDGNLLVSASQDWIIRLWRLPEGKYIARLRGHRYTVTSLAIAPDGSLLASGSHDATVRLWRMPEGTRVATLRGHGDEVVSLAITPDGRLLASGSRDATIRLWRLPDGASFGTLGGHTGPVSSLAVTPDGSLLASSSHDATVRLWSLPEGACVETLRGHGDEVDSLVVTPDGSLLASASRDNTVRLWSVSNGACIASLRGHAGWVESLAITSDGSLLASGAWDRTIRLWRSEIAALTTAPVAALVRDHGRLLALRRDGGAAECAWLDFMLALVDRHRRFDIQVEVSRHVEVGEFDIEIGE